MTAEADNAGAGAGTETEAALEEVRAGVAGVDVQDGGVNEEVDRAA